MPQVQTRPSQARSVAQPHRLPLIATPDSRDPTGAKDARLINGYAEKDILTGDWWIYKRPGYSTPQWRLSGNGRGMFCWVGSVTVTYNPVVTPQTAFGASLGAGDGPSGVVGYTQGGYGSLAVIVPGGLVGYNVISAIDNLNVNQFSIEISGFTADPTQSFITSVVINSNTFNQGTATYSYLGGLASWTWNSVAGMVSGLAYNLQINLPNITTYVPVYAANPLVVMLAGTTFYRLTQPSSGSPVLSSIASAVAAGGVMRFCQIPAVTPLLMFSDGSNNAYFYNGTTVTKITDSHYPTTPVPGIVILDGTIYVMDVEGNIWGSTNANDPTTWSSTNFIKAQIEGDLGVYLGKQLNYVVAMKQWTIEFFYDAGNASPGSPLAPVTGAMLNYGCLSAQTVQDFYNMQIFVTYGKNSAPQVAILENLQLRMVSTPPIERLLLGATPNTGFYSMVWHRGGHRFYIVSRLDTGVTFCYDIDQHFWSTWTGTSGGIWPIIAQSNDFLGHSLLQDQLSGSIYFGDVCSTYPSDAGVVAPIDVYTPNFDAGVDRRKQLNFLRINADQQPGAVLLSQYSDDDYQSWSSYREIDLSEVRPYIDREGTFYKRAYHFRHACAKPFRMRSADLQLDIGTL